MANNKVTINFMISYNELKKGIRITIDKEPYEILESSSMFKARGHSVLQTKLKKLKTGNVISRTFHPYESFEEAEVFRKEARFIYSHKEKYVFSEKDNPSQRFELTGDQIGEKKEFLKSNQPVGALVFNNEVINIILPIKINLKVTEAPPGIKGERAQAGTKTATLETGAKINVPIFINSGDMIEVNSETGEYVRRIE